MYNTKTYSLHNNLGLLSLSEPLGCQNIVPANAFTFCSL